MRLVKMMAAAVAVAGAIPAQPQFLIPPTPAPRVVTMCAVGVRVAPPTEAQVRARAFRRPQVSGRKLQKAVGVVRRELKWYEKLDAAAAAARAAGKPIVWIQALGDLDGYT